MLTLAWDYRLGTLPWIITQFVNPRGKSRDLARIFHQFRREIADSQTGLALERPLSETTSKPVVSMKRSQKRQERSAQTSEATIATEI